MHAKSTAEADASIKNTILQRMIFSFLEKSKMELKATVVGATKNIAFISSFSSFSECQEIWQGETGIRSSLSSD